jgi:DNA-binding MarR family transcriptional regulator
LTESAHTRTSNTDDFFEKYGLRILRTIRQIIRAVDIHSRKLNSEFKITAPQMICLYGLQREGRMTLSDLAENVNLGKSTVNGIVDRLEEKALLSRSRCTVDRRKVYLEITEQGVKLTESAPSLIQDRLAAALKKLPELEQAAIALSLERVAQLMEAEDLDASPNLLLNLPNESNTKDG